MLLAKIKLVTSPLHSYSIGVEPYRLITTRTFRNEDWLVKLAVGWQEPSNIGKPCLLQNVL